ncbi:MAG: hypothetical protein ACXQTE_01300 [Methanosarcinaceae archaeon]
MNHTELYDLLNYYRRRHARTGVLTAHCAESIAEFGYRIDDVKQMIMKGNATGWRGPDIALAYSSVEAREKIRRGSRYGAIYS